MQKQFPPSWIKAGKNLSNSQIRSRNAVCQESTRKPRLGRGNQLQWAQVRLQPRRTGGRKSSLESTAEPGLWWAAQLAEDDSECSTVQSRVRTAQAPALWFSKDGHSRDKAVYWRNRVQGTLCKVFSCHSSQVSGQERWRLWKSLQGNVSAQNKDSMVEIHLWSTANLICDKLLKIQAMVYITLPPASQYKPTS